MSEVISSWLNKENPRERQALEIIKTHQTEGHSIRSIVVEALLYLNASRVDPDQLKLDELNDTLNQVKQLLYRLGNGWGDQEVKATDMRLTDNFIESIKESAKPGEKLGQSD